MDWLMAKRSPPPYRRWGRKAATYRSIKDTRMLPTNTEEEPEVVTTPRSSHKKREEEEGRREASTLPPPI
jgi:hypothetical protein